MFFSKKRFCLFLLTLSLGLFFLPAGGLAAEPLSPFMTSKTSREPSAKQGRAADLRRAAARGDLDTVRRILKTPADINARDKNGFTPLMLAAQYGHTEVVQALIDGGALVNLKADSVEGDHWTALMLAVSSLYNGNADIVRILIKAGADVNATATGGYSVLMAAMPIAKMPRDGDWGKILKMLLKAGANVNGRDEKGYTALMFASCVARDCPDCVNTLVGAGAKVDLKTKEGLSALAISVSRDYPKITKALIDAGAEVKNANCRGYTPLMLIASQKAESPDQGPIGVDVAKILLEAGADVNQTFEGGAPSALICAVDSDNYELVQLFIDAKADLNAVDCFSQTALMHSIMGNHAMITGYLIASTAVPDADINIRRKDGSTALMIAAEKDSAMLAKLLIAAGADVTMKNNKGETALSIAEKGGHEAVAAVIRKAAR